MRLLIEDAEFTSFEAEVKTATDKSIDVTELEAWFLYEIRDVDVIAAFHEWDVNSGEHFHILENADVTAETFFELLPEVTDMRLRFESIGVDLPEAVTLASRGFPLV